MSQNRELRDRSGVRAGAASAPKARTNQTGGDRREAQSLTRSPAFCTGTPELSRLRAAAIGIRGPRFPLGRAWSCLQVLDRSDISGGEKTFSPCQMPSTLAPVCSDEAWHGYAAGATVFKTNGQYNSFPRLEPHDSP